MFDYHPPLRDMHFVLSGLAGGDTLSSLPGFEEVTPDVIHAVLEEAGKFASGVLAPLNRQGDVQGCRFENGQVSVPDGWSSAYKRFAAAGWIGLTLPVDYGGQGLPKRLFTAVWEMWFSANMAFTMLPQLNVSQAEALLIAATDEQKALWLHKIVSGEWASTMNLTEPQAGSDLAATRTRAEPCEDGRYRLYGQKIFISYGEHDLTSNIVHLVLARLPDAPEGVKGLSLFLVPKYLPDDKGQPVKLNDVRCISIEHKMGIHGSPTCTMSYGDQGGAIGWLVGAPHRGLETMFIMMNEARFGVGLQGLGLGERAYQFAVAYARNRVQGRNVVNGKTGLPIIHHPDVKRMLLSMRARVMAMRGMLYTVAGWFDTAHHHPDKALAEQAGRYIDLLMPVVKGWCTETGREVCDEAIQVFGGMGFVEETGVAQLFRDARITTIYEGTTGIQANDLIGRKILREQGATLNALLAEINQCIAALKADADLSDIGYGLGKSTAALSDATRWLLERGSVQDDATWAGAVPFLHLLGTVCGAWQMARLAQAVRGMQQNGADVALDAEYCASLLELARFYMATVNPKAAAWAVTVKDAGFPLSRFPEQAF